MHAMPPVCTMTQERLALEKLLAVQARLRSEDDAAKAELDEAQEELHRTRCGGRRAPFCAGRLDCDLPRKRLFLSRDVESAPAAGSAELGKLATDLEVQVTLKQGQVRASSAGTTRHRGGGEPSLEKGVGKRGLSYPRVGIVRRTGLRRCGTLAGWLVLDNGRLR
jgi:hypothetical protein